MQAEDLLVDVSEFLFPRSVVMAPAVHVNLLAILEKLVEANFEGTPLDRVGIDQRAIEVKSEDLCMLDYARDVINGNRRSHTPTSPLTTLMSRRIRSLHFHNTKTSEASTTKVYPASKEPWTFFSVGSTTCVPQALPWRRQLSITRAQASVTRG